MPRILGDVTNSAIVARREDLAVVVEGIIDSSVHASGEKLKRGTLMGKVGSGKFRAYAEATLTAATATTSPNFSVDPAGPIAQHLRVGDSLESVDGNGLGIIASYNPLTGAGTFTTNALAVQASGSQVRVVETSLTISGGAGRILQDEHLMEGADEPFAGYCEGFFTKSRTTVTSSAVTTMGSVVVTADEIRLK